MITALFTFAALATASRSNSKPVAKVVVTTEPKRPEYLQRVDELCREIFSPERVEHYKKLGLM